MLETAQTAAAKNQDNVKARWTAVTSLALGVFGLVTAEFLPVSLLTPISESLGVTTGAAGQSIAVTALVAALSGPAVVIGLRKVDRRLIVLALTTLLVLSSLLSAFAHSLTVLLISRLLLGIGLGGFWAMSSALTARLVPDRLLPRAMSVVLSGISLATVIAAPLGAWIGSTLGWRAAFIISAALAAVALAVQLFSLPSLPPAGHSGTGGFRRVMKLRKVRTGLITIMLVVIGQYAGFTYVRPYLETVADMNVETISLILLAYGIGGFFGNFIGGFMEGRSPQRAVVMSTGLLGGSVIMLTAGGTAEIVAACAVGLWGLAFGAVLVSMQTYVLRAAPDEEESAGALASTLFQLSISAGAVLGGVIISLQGPVGAMAFTAVLCLMGTVFMGVTGGTKTPSRGGVR